jgi:hypothetical protein
MPTQPQSLYTYITLIPAQYNAKYLEELTVILKILYICQLQLGQPGEALVALN